jgi:hypothetical protein
LPLGLATTFQIAARRVGSPHAMLMSPPGLPSGKRLWLFITALSTTREN